MSIINKCIVCDKKVEYLSYCSVECYIHYSALGKSDTERNIALFYSKMSDDEYKDFKNSFTKKSQDKEYMYHNKHLHYLPDWYIKQLIKAKTPELRKEDIPIDAIKIQRKIIQLKRNIKIKQR